MAGVIVVPPGQGEQHWQPQPANGWIEVLTVMEAVRRSFSGREALETLRARLTPLSDPQAIDAVTDTLRSIARALDDFQPVQLAPDLVLDRLIEEARLQVDAAARHLRADPPL